MQPDWQGLYRQQALCEGITGNRKTYPFWLVRRQRSSTKNEKLLGGETDSFMFEINGHQHIRQFLFQK
jgi:hypothetical protein